MDVEPVLCLKHHLLSGRGVKANLLENYLGVSTVAELRSREEDNSGIVDGKLKRMDFSLSSV